MSGPPTAVIGLAHGSRHPGVQGPIAELMAAASGLTGAPARTAFLDLTEPDLGTVCAQLAADGVRRAIVVPLLFTNAFHARVDVPTTVAGAASSSGLELRTAGILGTGDDVASVVRAAVDDAEIAADDSVLLYAVGSSDDAANDAVADLAARLAALRGAPVRVAFGTTDPRPEKVLAAFAADSAVAIVPLFVSPGLLLDPLARLARERGWPITAPLGARLAPVAAARYAEAI